MNSLTNLSINSLTNSLKMLISSTMISINWKTMFNLLGNSLIHGILLSFILVLILLKLKFKLKPLTSSNFNLVNRFYLKLSHSLMFLRELSVVLFSLRMSLFQTLVLMSLWWWVNGPLLLLTSFLKLSLQTMVLSKPNIKITSSLTLKDLWSRSTLDYKSTTKLLMFTSLRLLVIKSTSEMLVLKKWFTLRLNNTDLVWLYILKIIKYNKFIHLNRWIVK